MKDKHTPDLWIKHTPGDPMPVDGDTLVSARLKNNTVTSIRPARGFEWSDGGGGYNITAYRIHKPEEPAPLNHSADNSLDKENTAQPAGRITIPAKPFLDAELNAINGVLMLDEAARDRVIEYLAKRDGYEVEDME